MGLLDIVIIILVIAWLGGFSLHIGGGLIHLLLVIAVIVLVARLLGVNV
ncbi:MAG: hypothetical protein UV26_C0011G0024 [candidate division WWE3 bacterium GW2011_GWF2_42_42]|uniref:Lmo0937 family membrane protein n=1 Tax=candidate division WWE3 bacterium GW2011_GWF2_42_42 TaxID=1619142 RepID=A0A0G1AG89_UNCKA|nr:MAG: hypothetical protein UV26_C0011G0024 [candidate division WWE3 bacterium GW2011_GWF2_42_42]